MQQGQVGYQPVPTAQPGYPPAAAQPGPGYSPAGGYLPPQAAQPGYPPAAGGGYLPPGAPQPASGKFKVECKLLMASFFLSLLFRLSENVHKQHMKKSALNPLIAPKVGGEKIIKYDFVANTFTSKMGFFWSYIL